MLIHFLTVLSLQNFEVDKLILNFCKKAMVGKAIKMKMIIIIIIIIIIHYRLIFANAIYCARLRL